MWGGSTFPLHLLLTSSNVANWNSTRAKRSRKRFESFCWDLKTVAVRAVCILHWYSEASITLTHMPCTKALPGRLPYYWRCWFHRWPGMLKWVFNLPFMLFVGSFWSFQSLPGPQSSCLGALRRRVRADQRISTCAGQLLWQCTVCLAEYSILPLEGAWTHCREVLWNSGEQSWQIRRTATGPCIEQQISRSHKDHKDTRIEHFCDCPEVIMPVG